LAHLSEPHFEGELAVMYEIGSQKGTQRSAATRQSVEAVVFSPDSKRLYSAGCEGTIKVWDTAVWKDLSTLSPAEDRCVRALAFSPDGKWLISAAEDGQILFWDAGSNRLSARLLVGVDGKQWLVVGGDGHFDGTDDGIRSLAVWRIGNRLVSLDSLPTEFRVKGLLQKMLSGQTHATTVTINTILQKQ
jgi:WD40 repeat protein